jgi:hypothetical protein
MKGDFYSICGIRQKEGVKNSASICLLTAFNSELMVLVSTNAPGYNLTGYNLTYSAPVLMGYASLHPFYGKAI